MKPDVPWIDGLEDLQAIGRGGFSIVYRAWQPSAARHVAVKVLQTTLDEESSSRFERECQLLGQLSTHPGFCTLYASGQTGDGRPYLVIELCTRSLADRLRSEGTLSVEETVSTLCRVGAALDHAHGRGILHRDIKPENILVTQFGDPVLADFGIARIDGGWSTTSGLVTASLGHAAPEVLDGKRPTVRSDLWSLVSTGYQLLLGHPPFLREEEPSSTTITRIFRDSPPDLTAMGVPEQVRSTLEAALSKDPEERPGGVAEFIATLGVHLAATTSNTSSQTTLQVDPELDVTVEEEGPDRTVVMKPPPTEWSANGRLARRSRWPVALVGLVVAGVFAMALRAALDRGDEPAATDASSRSSSTDTSTAGAAAPVVIDSESRSRLCVSGSDESTTLRATRVIESDNSNLLAVLPADDCGVRDAAVIPEVRNDSGGGPWRYVEWNGITGWTVAAGLEPLDRWCVVDSSPLNLRSGPGLDQTVLATIPVDSCDVFDHARRPQVEPAGGRAWRRVWWGDETGWVAADLLARQAAATLE